MKKKPGDVIEVANGAQEFLTAIGVKLVLAELVNVVNDPPRQ